MLVGFFSATSYFSLKKIKTKNQKRKTKKRKKKKVELGGRSFGLWP
jgi:hypothetical protein